MRATEDTAGRFGIVKPATDVIRTEGARYCLAGVAAALLLWGPGGGHASSVYDTFDDDSLSKTRWAVQVSPATGLDETGGRLEVSIAPWASEGAFAATAISYCWLEGDFDVETDYQLLSWPAFNGTRLGLTLTNGHETVVAGRASTSAYDQLGAREIYFMDSSPSAPVGIINTEDSAGALRIRRTGTEITGYRYDRNLAGWVVIATYPATNVGADNVRFRPNVWSHGQVFDPQGKEIRAAFDNVIINQGQLVCPVKEVQLDVKPGSEPNSINLGSAGVVPVAILSSPSFDAFTVVPESISLAGARVKMVGKSGKSLCHTEDANEDGLEDLVCQVLTAQFMIEEGESVAILEAETLDGTLLRGEDEVRIVP